MLRPTTPLSLPFPHVLTRSPHKQPPKGDLLLGSLCTTTNTLDCSLSVKCEKENKLRAVADEEICSCLNVHFSSERRVKVFLCIVNITITASGALSSCCHSLFLGQNSGGKLIQGWWVTGGRQHGETWLCNFEEPEWGDSSVTSHKYNV